MKIKFVNTKFNDAFFLQEKATDTQYLQYCSVCEGYKAPRSHHCRKCKILYEFDIL